MDIGERTSRSVSNFVKKTLSDKSQSEIEEINYGVHVIINNILKLPVIFIISYFLGIFDYTLAAFLSFSVLRTFASGLHARKSISCFITTSVIFLGTAFLGKYIRLNLLDITVSFMVCITLAYLYAPADTEEKPLVSKKLRKKLKFLSCLIISALYLICLLLFKSVYASIITYAVIAECISITPFIYLIFKRRYNNYEAYDN